MLINLSELLSRNGDTKVFEANIGFDSFESRVDSYKIIDKSPFSLTVTNLGNRKITIEGDVRLSMNIPCNRCLEDVRTDIEFSIMKDVDMGESSDDRIKELDEQNYIDGYYLDVDKLVYGEILLNLPMKVLCREDCKGLCNKCGANLNHGECGCDRESLDPRMSVIRDIFNNYKEV